MNKFFLICIAITSHLCAMEQTQPQFTINEMSFRDWNEDHLTRAWIESDKRVEASLHYYYASDLPNYHPSIWGIYHDNLDKVALINKLSATMRLGSNNTTSSEDWKYLLLKNICIKLLSSHNKELIVYFPSDEKDYRQVIEQCGFKKVEDRTFFALVKEPWIVLDEIYPSQALPRQVITQGNTTYIDDKGPQGHRRIQRMRNNTEEGSILYEQDPRMLNHFLSYRIWQDYHEKLDKVAFIFKLVLPTSQKKKVAIELLKFTCSHLFNNGKEYIGASTGMLSENTPQNSANYLQNRDKEVQLNKQFLESAGFTFIWYQIPGGCTVQAGDFYTLRKDNLSHQNNSNQPINPNNSQLIETPQEAASNVSLLHDLMQLEGDWAYVPENESPDANEFIHF